MHTLRVRDQAKQATHSEPPLAFTFLSSSHSAAPDPEQENNKGILDKSQVPQTDPHAIGLHNLN
jgi:hypothetical protein